MIKDISNNFLKKIHEINLSGILMNKEVIHVSFDVVFMFPSLSNNYLLLKVVTIFQKISNGSIIFSEKFHRRQCYQLLHFINGSCDG